MMWRQWLIALGIGVSVSLSLFFIGAAFAYYLPSVPSSEAEPCYGDGCDGPAAGLAAIGDAAVKGAVFALKIMIAGVVSVLMGLITVVLVWKRFIREAVRDAQIMATYERDYAGRSRFTSVQAKKQ